MSKYKWIVHDGVKLCSIGILDDGTLHNPNSYPEDIVRAAVLAADARKHDRRSMAAKKAAGTRKSRQQKKIAQIARRILAGMGIGKRNHCEICGRRLDDPESVARGVGSECWQEVQSILLTIAEKQRGAA